MRDVSAATAPVDIDDEEEGKIYRGKLLAISQFLTSFHHYYSLDNEELDDGDLGFAITPRDIESALTYRYLLQCKADLLDEKSSLAVVGEDMEGGSRTAISGNASARLRVEDFLADVESQLEFRSQNKPKQQRDKRVNDLLERFEIWSAKDLAHTLLIPPTCGCHDQKQASTSCWSHLLHLPGAAYFAGRLPQPKNEGGGATGTEPGLVQEESKMNSSTEKPTEAGVSAMFPKLYHQAHIQPASHSLCSLILPPNRYTYEEYTRIAEMVSYLPEEARGAAASSPACGAAATMRTIFPCSTSINNNHISARKNNIYSPDFDFQAHDLVALWVRAQRSSAAMRHLIQIFSRPNESEVVQLECERQAGTSAYITVDLQHQVRFCGNHHSTKRKILAETKQVQDLVSWAVMNQVLFHQQYMKQQLHEQTKKRPRSSAACTSIAAVAKPGKKIRSEVATKSVKEEANAQSIVEDTKLLQACHAHLLRLFGQKHQPLLAIIYFANPSSFPSPAARIYNLSALSIFERSKEHGILSLIQEQLQKYAHGGDGMTGLSLARVDRRLRQGKYDSGSGLHGNESPFYETMSRLLRSWSEVMAGADSINVDPARLIDVVADFDRDYERFLSVLSQDGIIAAAKSLLDVDYVHGVNVTSTDDLDEHSVAQLSKLLLGTSAPWLESCGRCGKTAKMHPNPNLAFTTCANCERSFHQDCYDPVKFSVIKMRDLLPSDAQDSWLCSVDLPQSALTPDWRGSQGQMRWTEQCVTLRRTVMEDGRFETAGMSVRMTELSRNAMDFILSGQITFEKLYAQGFLESEIPLGLDNKINGALITEIHDKGACQRAGFALNDIILGIRFVEFAEGVEGIKAFHSFANLDKQKRLDHLKAKATVVELTILRPEKDILSQCFQWISVLRTHNDFMWKRCTDDSTVLSFCDVCCERNGLDGSIDDESEADRIKRDAQDCRAVIRRLGQQSYSRLFHFEEHNPTDPKDHVSLARLDAMMTYIMLVNSSHPQPEAVKRCHNAFFVPPWVSPNRARLSWAQSSSEKDPKEILFRGMGLLLRGRQVFGTSCGGVPTFQQEKEALFHHFVELSCAWLMPGLKHPIKVPPRSALSAAFPFSDTCFVCRVSPATMERNIMPVCNNKYCLRTMHENLWQDDYLANYCDNAKMIGTTLLVFPNDPWLAHVAEREGLKIDSFGRPVEFIATFYSPPLGDLGGQFFLHPVLSKFQLQFVLDRCSLLQKPPRSLSRASLEQWIEGTVLGLKGVLRVSKTDMITKIMETSQFLDDVGSTIEACARLNIRPSSPATYAPLYARKQTARSTLCSLIEGPLGMALLNNVNRYLVARVNKCAQLMESIVRLPTPIMQSMLDAWDSRRGEVTTKSVSPPFQYSDQWLCSSICSWTGSKRFRKANTGPLDHMNIHSGCLKLTSENFFHPKPPSGSNFQLLYTDLYFLSDEEKMNMSSVLDPQRLRLPVQFMGSERSRERTIVLRRPVEFMESTVQAYKGVGWGFELLQWQHESILRVGRVHPRSAASSSGLQLHDVLLSLNGRPIGLGYGWSIPYLVSSILASPLCVGRASHSLDIILNALMTVGSDGPVQGPLILKVHRPPPISYESETFQGRALSPDAHPADASDKPVVFRATLNRNSTPVETETAHALPTNTATIGSVVRPVEHRRDTKGTLLQHATYSPNNKTAIEDVEDPLLLLRTDLVGLSDAGAPVHVAMISHDGPKVHRTRQSTRGKTSPQAQQEAQRSSDQQTQSTQPEAANELIGIRSGHDEAIALVQGILPRLTNCVNATMATRHPLRKGDLYAALGMNTVLTKVEASVYLEAVHKEMPMMGLRLLRPRYSIQTLVEQVKQLHLHGESGDLNHVPLLPEVVFHRLLVQDYERWKKEPEIAHKSFDDKVWAYSFPTRTLPIDRTIEAMVRDLPSKSRLQEETSQEQQVWHNDQDFEPIQIHEATQQQHRQDINVHDEPSLPSVPWGEQQVACFEQPGSMLSRQPYASFFPPRPGNPPMISFTPYGYALAGPARQYSNEIHFHNNDNPAERIRGGGDSSDEEKEKGPPLLGTPLASWHNQVVSFEAETTREETSRGEALFIGRVELSEERRHGDNAIILEIDEVDVACFFASSVGVFDTLCHATVDPGDLFLITEGSRHFNLLRRINRKYAPLLRPSKQPDAKNQDNPSSSMSQEDEQATAPSVSAMAKATTLATVSERQSNGEILQPQRKDQCSSPLTGNSAPHEGPLSERSNHGDKRDPDRVCHFLGHSSSSMHTPKKHAGNSAVEKASYNFARKHGQARGFKEPLGKLPDGRLVYWFPNDPCALYIQESGESSTGYESCLSKRFRETISVSNRERIPNERICLNVDAHCCLWGCTFEPKDKNTPLRLAEFHSRELLDKHTARFHAYGTNPKESFLLGESVNFVRVGDTGTLKKIIRGLTSSACALSVFLQAKAKTDVPAIHENDPSGQRIVCSPSRYLCSLSMYDLFAAAESQRSADDRNTKRTESLQLVHLLLKIQLIFDLGYDGSLIHLSPGAIRGLRGGRPREERERRTSGEYRRTRSCSIDSRWNTHADDLHCSLCALPTEAVVILRNKNDDNIVENGILAQNLVGIGCAIPSSLLVQQSAVATPVHGGFGFAKRMLLGIATNVPSQIYSCQPNNRNVPFGNIGKHLWKKVRQGFDTIVQQCSSVPALAQALVVLVASIEHDKLPLWWRAGEYGWQESAQRLLLCPSMSCLILQLYLFEFALLEYISMGPREKPYKTLTTLRSLQLVSNTFEGLSTERRVQLLLESAAANSISRYHGRHDLACCVCDDSGTLVCCDFCPSTVHASCCSPALSDETARWVCLACTVDIIELGV